MFRLALADEDAETADLWVVNSCTVKSPSQSQMATVIRSAKSHSIPIVVAGCVPQGDKKSSDLQVSFRGEPSRLQNAFLADTRRRSRHRIALLTSGCLRHRRYANRPHRRGRGGNTPGQYGRIARQEGPPGTRPAEGSTQSPRRSAATVNGMPGRMHILQDQARPRPPWQLSSRCACSAPAVEDPLVREIWLSSEDTGAYGRDIDTSVLLFLGALCVLTFLPFMFSTSACEYTYTRAYLAVS
jgi:threonylcarbamoyladenosine tRNA methylthiotransferase CDKAL1